MRKRFVALWSIFVLSPTFMLFLSIAWLNHLHNFATMFRPSINFPARVEYFGKGERPPLSALRSVLILINFAEIRHFVREHLHKNNMDISHQM